MKIKKNSDKSTNRVSELPISIIWLLINSLRKVESKLSKEEVIKMSTKILSDLCDFLNYLKVLTVSSKRMACYALNLLEDSFHVLE